MPLLPSLKEKKRYMAYEVISKEKLNFNQVKKEIDESLFKYIGLLGTSKAGMQILKEKYNDNRGLIRINHKFTDHLKASFTLISKINNSFKQFFVSHSQLSSRRISSKKIIQINQRKGTQNQKHRLK